MKNALWVLRKEAREMMRDKRVIHGAFVAPVFLIILFLGLIGFVEQKVTSKPSLDLAIVADTNNPIVEAFEKAEGAKVYRVETEEAGRALLDEKKVKVVLVFSPNFDTAIADGEARITALFDESDTLSSVAMSGFRQAVAQANRDSLKKILEAQGLKPSLAEPIKFEPKPVSKGAGLAGSSIVGLLPYLIVLWAFYGGFSIVGDLVAGEKERGTMETLLIAPAQRLEIALGKFLALAVICLISSLTSLLAVLVLGALRLDMTKNLFPTGLHISVPSILAIALALVPLVMMFAGLLLSVSAAARNIRESQTYLTLVSFVVLMPAIFSQFIGFTGMQDALWVRFTPVLNAAVAIREALLAQANWTGVAITAGVSLVLAAVFLGIAVWLFQREQILSRV